MQSEPAAAVSLFCGSLVSTQPRQMQMIGSQRCNLRAMRSFPTWARCTRNSATLPKKKKSVQTFGSKRLTWWRKQNSRFWTHEKLAEEKIAELRQKELDGYKKQSDQIFDALRTPGSQGIRSFFNTQGNNLARTLFSNATAPALQFFGQSTAKLIGGQTTKGAQGNDVRTPLGNLLKDTIFDSAKSGKSPQVVALSANTEALNHLTGAITGKSVGGTPATTPDPTSLAGVVAREATGAAAFSGAPSVAASQLSALVSEGNAAGVAQFGISQPTGAASLFSF